MFAGYEQYSIIAYLHMFYGGEQWAISKPARGQSGACKTKTDKRSKCCIAIDLKLIMLRCPASSPTIE